MKGARGISSRRVGILLVTIVLCSALRPAGAQDRTISVEELRSERRVALVIGNAAYARDRLRNPVNDARAITTTLKQMGFEVLPYENLGEKEMRRAVDQFGDRLRGSGVGLFYFSGHGVQVKGKNYLIPVDVKIEAESEVEYEAVDIGRVLAKMESASNRLNIVILDACRNNPFERAWRSTSGGLAQMLAPSGTFIAYATAPGRVASDGPGINGLYTSELLKAMQVAGITLEQVFKRTGLNVKRQSGGVQEPWIASSVYGDFYFTLPQSGTIATAPTAVTVRPSPVSPPDPSSPSLPAQQPQAALPAPSTPRPSRLSGQVFLPLLVFRTGPYAPIGIPMANGLADYLTLLNERDGGIEGLRIIWEECETRYDTRQGVECYERLKGKHGGAVLFAPPSTGQAYQFIPKAPVDRIPILSTGAGMMAAADGRWFPWVFTVPSTYWSQATALVGHIASQEGGFGRLKGKKISHVYHNSPYGREANPTLEELARRYGFELTLLAVDHPGQEQKSTWLQIRRLNPDWIYVSGWGVMNQVAIKEAAALGLRMERIVGSSWAGAEADVIHAGESARGYKAVSFHAPGRSFRVHQDIARYVHDRGRGAGRREDIGEVMYNRGLVGALLATEAIRTALGRFGHPPISGEHVRWGLERLRLTERRLAEVGFAGLVSPLQLTCENHEGGGLLVVQQWDGKRWNLASDWIAPLRDIVRPRLEVAAEQDGKKLGYTMRDCSKEK